MRFTIIVVFIAMIHAAINAYSMDLTLKQKYPNILLTDDYNILNENDFSIYAKEIKTPSFSAKKGQETWYNYWQCFPRDHISITLEDMGDFSEDNGREESYADLKITAVINKNEHHEYYMRRAFPLSTYQDIFNTWENLMKNEKYVCLGGRFSHFNEMTTKGTQQKTYYWTFDKFKTKKGCNSYFTHE